MEKTIFHQRGKTTKCTDNRTSEYNNFNVYHENTQRSLAYYRDTGLRPIELHRLRLKNIDLENGTITQKQQRMEQQES